MVTGLVKRLDLGNKVEAIILKEHMIPPESERTGDLLVDVGEP